MAVAAMHRVRARSERLALAPSIRRIAGRLAVDDVRGDGEHALRMRRVSVRGMFTNLLHEAGHETGGDLIDAVIVVAELRRWRISFVLVIDHQTGCVAGHAN